MYICASFPYSNLFQITLLSKRDTSLRNCITAREMLLFLMCIRFENSDQTGQRTISDFLQSSILEHEIFAYIHKIFSYRVLESIIIFHTIGFCKLFTYGHSEKSQFKNFNNLPLKTEPYIYLPVCNVLIQLDFYTEFKRFRYQCSNIIQSGQQSTFA